MPSVPSQEYWIKRAEDVLVAGEKSELQYEKELTAAYKTTLQEIRKEINAFYTKYADEQEISLATARKRLSPGQLKDFQTMHHKYLAEAEKYGLDPAYQKHLRNLSGKAYISRLQELSSNIRHQVELLAGRNKNAVETVLQDGFEDSFYRTLFNVQKQAKIGVSFTQPGKEQLEAAVKEKWLESNYSDRIWADKNRLVNQLNQIIPREFVRGRGPVAMGRELAQKMNTSYNNAVRLARTEMNHISNKGTMEAYKKSKVVSEYEYVATLDSRTSDICASMDGKIFKVSEAQSGINMPPLHPHCRSTTIPHFPKDEIGDNIIDRIARDENDESYFVGEDVTYREWTEKYASASYAKKVLEQEKKVAVRPAAKPVPKKPVIVPPAEPEEIKLDTSIPSLQYYGKHYSYWESELKDRFASLTDSDIQMVNDFMKEFINNNDFCMRVPSRVLKKILDEGRFKNQFETKSSQGLLDYESRKQATEALFDPNITKLKDSDFEKYGYLGPKDTTFDYMRAKHRASQYGRTRITFKKSSLQKRTTFTIDDSLGNALDEAIVAGDVNNPRIGGIEDRKVSRIIAGLKDLKEKGTLAKTAADFNSTMIELFRGPLYVELQYHGDITIKDIEKISIPWTELERLNIEGVTENTPHKDIQKMFKDKYGVEVEILDL